MNAVAARKTTREFSARPIDAQTLSEILWTAWGLTHEGKHSIPTSQNKQNLKVYVLQADGVWRYNPEKNTLESISKKDVRGILNTQAFVKDAPLHLAFVGSRQKELADARRLSLSECRTVLRLQRPEQCCPRLF